MSLTKSKSYGINSERYVTVISTVGIVILNMCLTVYSVRISEFNLDQCNHFIACTPFNHMSFHVSVLLLYVVLGTSLI